MRLDVEPPKYVTIINTIQSRIEDGTYQPDAKLPSEAALTREFGVARPTLVRALEYLRQHGWLESRQGRGRFVLGVPAVDRHQSGRHGLTLFDTPETATVRILAAGPVAAPKRAAAHLGIASGTRIIVRRRLIRADTGEPIELSTVFATGEVGEGTSLGARQPIAEGLLRHLRHAPIDLAKQTVSARLPSAGEARLLIVGSRECLLVVVLTLCARAGRPLVAVEFLLPAGRHTLSL